MMLASGKILQVAAFYQVNLGQHLQDALILSVI
jgi:hypothetical protein